MSYKKFTENDIFLNTMRAYPKVNFFVYAGNVYYNNIPTQIGNRNTTVRNAPEGYISLYEYNIDRPDVPLGSTGDADGTRIPRFSLIDESGSVKTEHLKTGPIDRGRIAPWISKDSARSSFKTVGAFVVGKSAYNSEFQYGDTLQGSYPLSASITRELVTGSKDGVGATTSIPGFPTIDGDKHYVALRNRLDFYAVRSLHYKVDSPYGNKDAQWKNLISIPSIFYGTKIKPGSLSLKWMITGSVIGELRDTRENGELVQVSGSAGIYSPDVGKVAGVVLYDEGIVLLTGSWDMNGEQISIGPGGTLSRPKWIYFGVGAHDGHYTYDATFASASFSMDFKGHTETQVVSMFAHAKRGETNYSNNPTFLTYGQDHMEYTSSHSYEQRSDLLIKNTVSSSYSDYSASFHRQVYVSRVAIYDKLKNLVGVATLSNPILKKEDQDLSFKIKLDI